MLYSGNFPRSGNPGLCIIIDNPGICIQYLAPVDIKRFYMRKGLEYLARKDGKGSTVVMTEADIVKERRG